MAFSANTKYGALIAALLPVAASVYQQGQSQHAKAQDQSERQRTQEEQQKESHRSADAASALALHEALQDDLPAAVLSTESPQAASSLKFCSQLFIGAAQLQVNPAAEQTNATLLAAISYRKQDGSRAACVCGAHFFESIQAEWFDQAKSSPAARERAHDRSSDVLSRRFLDGLRAAQNECFPQAAGKAAEELAAEVVHRDRARNPPSPPPPPRAAAECTVEKIEQPTGRVLVYIQIADESQRDGAAKLQRGLNAQPPFRAPGIEKVGAASSPSHAEVRYFYDDDRTAAAALTKSLNDGADKCGLPAAEARVRQFPQFQGRVAHGVLEIWYPQLAAGGHGS